MLRLLTALLIRPARRPRVARRRRWRARRSASRAPQCRWCPTPTPSAPGKPFRVGLRLRLAPGWHTYWQNPGDAGVPPELELTLPPGGTAGPIDWPAPRRIAEGPLMTYAYTGDLLLPVTMTPRRRRHTLVKAHAEWLVCRDICVPEEADFRLDLPAGTGAPSAQAPLFAALERQVPRPSPWQARARPRRHAVGAGAGTDAGHRGRCLVHPGRAGRRSATAPRSR